MGIVGEASKADADDKAWLAAVSSLRTGLTVGAWDEIDCAYQTLQHPPSAECEALWLRLHSHLGRALSLLRSPHAGTTRRGFSADDVRTAVVNLLWLGECLTEEGDSPVWLRTWEDEWHSRLPHSLRKYFEVEEVTFRAWLEGTHGGGAPETAVTSTPDSHEPSLPKADDELLQAFLAEMDEGLRHTEELLLQLERSPSDPDLLHALFRQYHTLKGAAGAVELHGAAEQLHQGESLLQALRDGELELPAAAVVDFFLRLGDSVRAMIEEACGREPTAAKMDNLDDAIAALLQGEHSVPSAPARPSLAPQNEFADSIGCTTAQRTSAGPNPCVPHLQALREKAQRGQLDPELVAIIEALEQRAEFFASMAASLQAEVEELRTVSAAEVFRRLGRPLRDAARSEGKEVRLETLGGELRIPKDFLEPLAEVLLHLVRNAVAHGIEPPQERQRKGKDAEGLVRVALQREDAALRISVIDDGRGIDYGAIRQKAIALGWLAADSPSDERTLQSFLFRPGFSTRASADVLAGRGVGMDVVATQVQRLGGHVVLHSQAGRGTAVEILLPLPAAGGLRQ